MDRVEDISLDFDELARRNIRFVKIDARTILARRPGHDADEDAAEDTEAFVQLLKDGLNDNEINLIVDKLETEGDLVELLDHEIDYGQGYLFGEPRISREA